MNHWSKATNFIKIYLQINFNRLDVDLSELCSGAPLAAALVPNAFNPLASDRRSVGRNDALIGRTFARWRASERIRRCSTSSSEFNESSLPTLLRPPRLRRLLLLL